MRPGGPFPSPLRYGSRGQEALDDSAETMHPANETSSNCYASPSFITKCGIAEPGLRGRPPGSPRTSLARR